MASEVDIFLNLRGRDSDINHYRENSYCQENPERGVGVGGLTNVKLSE